MNSPYKIGVVGIWHLGEIYSAGLAELGHQVIGFDEDEHVIRALKKGLPPLAEQKLAELLASNRAAGRLEYSTEFSKISECNVVWITLDTPVTDDDDVQLEGVFTLVERSIPYLRDDVLFVISSQIPIGTSEKIITSIRDQRPDLKFQYAYSPENLRLGDAVNCFMNPGRIVVGTKDPVVLTKFAELFLPLHTSIVSMSPASAEMTKHALNAFLATSISFANDIADLCELYGADAETVLRALKSDPRIGSKAYLFPGLGFSGGTLGRDLKSLAAAASVHAAELPVIRSVFLKNKSRNAIVHTRLAKELGTIAGKTLALFGVTYKAGTSTLRRSQPLEIEKALREAGAVLRLYDPIAKSEEVAAFTPSFFAADPYEAVRGAHGIVLLTPWKEFRDLDFPRLSAAMNGTLFFDTCNILWDIQEDLRSAGFSPIRVGE